MKNEQRDIIRGHPLRTSRQGGEGGVSQTWTFLDRGRGGGANSPGRPDAKNNSFYIFREFSRNF